MSKDLDSLLDKKVELNDFLQRLAVSSNKQKLIHGDYKGDDLKIYTDEEKITHILDKDMRGAFLQRQNDLCFLVNAKGGQKVKGAVHWPGLDDIQGGRLIHTQKGQAQFHHTGRFVEFDQETVIERLSPDKRRLKKAVAEYGGLCDILCNDMVMEDMLATRNFGQGASQSVIPRENQFDRFKKTEVIERLENDVSKLHILKQVSIFQLLKAALFNKIPNNILSSKDQKGLNKLNKKTPEEIKEGLGKAVDNLPEGKSIKFMVYSKKGINFSGHTMLVRKNTNGSFTLFDPNEGAKVYNSREDMVNSLYDKQQEYREEFNFNNVCFVDPEKMLPKKELKREAEAKVEVKAETNIKKTL